MDESPHLPCVHVFSFIGVSDIPRLTRQDLTVPNAISAIRLVLIPVFAILVITHHDLAALIVVALSSISDWADGFIARKFNQVSELGKSLDPIADRCFIIVALLTLVVRGEVPLWLLGLVLLRDVVMLILVSAVAKSGSKPMAVTYVGKAATLCILVALPLFILAALVDSTGFSSVVRVIAWLFAIPGVVLYWASAAQYLQRGAAILKSKRAGESASGKDAN